VVGAVSALGAAAAATVQLDIKKVLAYSTISQLGFMFVALGAGAWAAAFFHLVTHAAFKGLLFLAAGSVIHGAGTQDLHEMGGLARPMRTTFVTWVVGACALAGLPLTAGFASKEGILGSVWETAPAACVVLFAAGMLTAFYSARATRLAFLGPRTVARALESSASMRVPLVLLAAAALGLGWFGPAFYEALHTAEEPLSLAVAATATVLALVGGAAGWVVARTVERDRSFLARLGWAGGVLARGYGWDRLVEGAIVRPVVVGCRVLWAWGDRFVVDGIVEGTARWVLRAGTWLSTLQSGDAQEYATAIALTVTVMLLATIWMGS
jgi:NADH-quinone oxidoreductase subunit L